MALRVLPHVGLGLSLGGAYRGPSSPPWTPDLGFTESGSIIYAWSEAGSAGETTSGGRVTSTPDLAHAAGLHGGVANPFVVPPSVAGAQGPLLGTTGTNRILGRPAWLCNPADLTGLIRSTFNFQDTSASQLTIAIIYQRTNVTSSQTLVGLSGGRPFARTFNVDSLTFSAASTPATAGAQAVDGAMGPSLALMDFDAGTDLQTLWRDDGAGGVVKIGETANANAFLQLHNSSLGIAFGGHPSSAYANGYEGKIAAILVIRGILTLAEKQNVGAWFANYGAPMRGPVSVWITGQSNEQMDGISNFYRYAARRDAYAARDNATISGDVREQQAWGPLNHARLTGSLRGFDWECFTQLLDNYRIRAHLFNCTRSGTGFYTSGGVADPLGWLPAALNGGTNARQLQRLFDLVDGVRTANPAATAALKTFCLLGQKETDGIHPDAAAAFRTNIEGERSAILAKYPDDDITFVVPLQNPQYTGANKAVVRGHQEDFVAAHADVEAIDCDDQNNRVGDDAHLDTNHHIALGQRFAALIDAAV
jgi:hypothetical protein